MHVFFVFPLDLVSTTKTRSRMFFYMKSSSSIYVIHTVQVLQ